MYECKKSEQYDTADVPTYEEVTTYRRKHGDRHRLVVLVGKYDKFGVFFSLFIYLNSEMTKWNFKKMVSAVFSLVSSSMRACYVSYLFFYC